MVGTTTMTTTSQPKLVAAGRASITGIAILANPRMIPASKSIILDAQLYLGPTDEDMLIGSLRYFNSTDSSFDDGPNFYVIYATFARRESKADVQVSGNRSLLDYTFVGDIDWFIPLAQLFPHSDETHADPNNLPASQIDPRMRPYVQVTGVAMSCSKADATFEVTVEQYISCFRSTKDAGVSHSKPSTTFFCYIPDSPIYRNWSAKPVPGNKRFVSLCGFLTGVDKSDGLEVGNFRIEVKNITFCGQYVQPAMAQSSPVKMPGSQSIALLSYNPPAPQTPSSKHSSSKHSSSKPSSSSKHSLDGAEP